MQKFLNMVRQQAAMVNQSRNLTDVGIVAAYDPANYLVRVQLYPQDGDTPALQTGWIPLFTPWMGNGWGLYAPPNIGDVIEVHYQAGSIQNAYAGLRSFNFGSRPVSGGVPSGEFWLIHQSGSALKLTNDGKVSLNANIELDLTAPVVKIISPDVRLGNGALNALLTAAAATVYNGHTHPVAGANTLAPTQQMTGDSTTNTQAS